MKTFNKSVLIWYSAQEMFALVTDVAQLSRIPALVRPRLEVVERGRPGHGGQVGISQWQGVRQSVHHPQHDHVD